LEWGRAHNGIADVSGVSAEQLQAFSTRAGEIDAYLAEHGWSGAEARQTAALRTREPRTQGVRDPARQHDRVGWDPCASCCPNSPCQALRPVMP
jgi:conjugative relaxase-like TrwC/TraI family protein